MLTLKSFTLTELMVVIIVLGILAGYALPNYARSVERAHMREASGQLRAVHAANQIYRAQNGEYWPGDGNDYPIANINSNLGINLIENGMTFSCKGSDGSTFTCTATRDGAAFVVTLTEALLSAANPVCSGGCP